jgi:hypothetical protein
MKTTILKISFIFLFLSFMGAGCEKDDGDLNELEGYIVGFDPCSYNHHYRIGYVIVSIDLKDTLVTYNLSDDVWEMPSSVQLNSSNTLYTIPESYFKAERGYYFPELARNELKVKITYRYPKEEEKTVFVCNIDLFLNYKEIIITSLKK